MCGVVGLLPKNATVGIADLVARANATLFHRGPDGGDTWVDESNKVGLGHRRLAILDTTLAGHQPMTSKSGRYVIVYNGEIYNFESLKQRLSDECHQQTWSSHSDTEVLLAAIEAWGVVGCLPALTGMYAFAVWDAELEELTLVRDRVGEKPLYYGYANESFVFGSELKAIKAMSESAFDIDLNALAKFMQLSYIPAPYSIYRQIKKLLPGHYLQVKAGSPGASPVAYWSLDDLPSDTCDFKQCADADIASTIHEQLKRVVAGQMVSDVPLGAFLSGGIDSSLITAIMQSQSASPIKTFTIGFTEDAYNEAPYAKAVAEHLGTDHTELYITAEDAAAAIQHLADIYDEPFGDSSQIPTYLVSRLVKQHVTVALSGDGADEVFAGYPRYQLVAGLWKRINRWPRFLRTSASLVLGSLSATAWDTLLTRLPAAVTRKINGRRLNRLSHLLKTRSLEDMYTKLMSHWQLEDGLVLGASKTITEHPASPGADSIDVLRRIDMRHYLPDDLMVKVDRASMYSSLETRAPFLDHTLIGMAMSLPAGSLVNRGRGKKILRDILDFYVPNHLIERPKSGFSVPIADWLRGPLMEWALALLKPIQMQGYLDTDKVNKAWEEHQSGAYDRSTMLWNILVFQLWLAKSNE